MFNMSSSIQRVVTPGRYTPPILRSSKPEVLPSNHVERQRVQEEIERMRLQGWQNGDSYLPGVSIDDLVDDQRIGYNEDDGNHSVTSEGSRPISSCQSLKKVSFRCDDDLEQVREIPPRPGNQDNDSFSDKRPKSRTVQRKPKKILTNMCHMKDGFPMRRPKTGPQSKSSEITQHRIKTVKSAPPGTQGRHGTLGKGRALSADKNSRKLNSPRQYLPLLSPLLQINSKTISSRQNGPLKTVGIVNKSNTLPHKEIGAEIEVTSSLPHAFDNCTLGGDSDTSSCLATQRMHAWHVANTCDFSDLHSPHIVPLWE